MSDDDLHRPPNPAIAGFFVYTVSKVVHLDAPISRVLRGHYWGHVSNTVSISNFMPPDRIFWR